MSQPSVDEIIADYLIAIESNGVAPERERLLADYPQFADQLRSFFSDLDHMTQAVANRSIEETGVSEIDGERKPVAASGGLGAQENANAPNRGEGTSSDGGPEGRRNIGPYRLLQRIGSGGMGDVWMAEQRRPVRRHVALKLVKRGMATRQILARFEAERQALALMEHQNIAHVLDAGTTEEGQPYFVMELVQGVPITEYCDQNRLGIPERLKLFVPVCRAAQHAHQKGIIHRDLKPSNILVTLYDGHPVPKVIDFGLAKALQHQSRLTDKTLFTEFGQVLGTLQYMSPEQAEMNALDIDTRTDVYSLGVLLYELLTGTTPIERDTLKRQAIDKVIQTIRETDPPKPSVRLSSTGDSIGGISQQRRIEPRTLTRILRGDLDWIVMKALEKDRTRRYATSSGLADDVQRYLSGDPIEARPPSMAYRARKFAKKNQSLVFSLLLISAVLVISTSISIWFAVSASNERHQAQLSAQEANSNRIRANRLASDAKFERDRAINAEQAMKNAIERERTMVSAALVDVTPSKRRFLASTPSALAADILDAQKDAAKAFANIESIRVRLSELDCDPEEPGYRLLNAKTAAASIRCRAYNEMLARLKRGMEFSNESSNTWMLEPHAHPNRLEEEVRSLKSTLSSLAKEQAGTTWATMAYRELALPIGWKWLEGTTISSSDSQDSSDRR